LLNEQKYIDVNFPKRSDGGKAVEESRADGAAAEKRCDPINGSAKNEIFAGRRWVSGTYRRLGGAGGGVQGHEVPGPTVKTWAVDGYAFESDRILL
jgi:hypothetical protein